MTRNQNSDPKRKYEISGIVIFHFWAGESPHKGKTAKSMLEGYFVKL